MCENVIIILHKYIWFTLSSPLEMKMTYSWIIYSCLIIGSGVLCDGLFMELFGTPKILANTKFYCSNGKGIDLSTVCDGDQNCSDGSDETKALCTLFEYRTDCGRINITNHAMEVKYNERIIDITPWTVFVMQLNTKNPKDINIVCLGSLIAPNVVISVARCFWQEYSIFKKKIVNKDLYKLVIPPIKSMPDINIQLIDIERIYLSDDEYNGYALGSKEIAVIVLANKYMSVSNSITPVCIDWNNKYTVQNEAREQYFFVAVRYNNDIPNYFSLEESFTYIDRRTSQKINTNKSAENVNYDIYTKFPTGLGKNGSTSGAGISILRSNFYSLTDKLSKNEQIILIEHYLPWIREILNMHRTINACILPAVEGVVYSYEGSHEILPHGTLINKNLTVIENCEPGYYKTYNYSSRLCQGKAKWSSKYNELCSKMCPPLTSDSLDIKCTHNGNYADCSNFLRNGTIAISSCKPTYLASYVQETPQTLVCQPDGMWNKKLDIYTPPKSCVLPTVEGVKYSYEGSNEILSHGTLINQNLTVFENCELGYYKINPNSSRICQRYGIWKSATDKLCLKMCPPLTSDTSDFKCTLNGNYADCSNFSMPNTIAIPSCKPTYNFALHEQNTPPELVCQSSGTWDEQLYECSPSSTSCVLPTVKGVVYSYNGSSEILPHGSLINQNLIILENCEPGYYKRHRYSFRVCHKNREWIWISPNLCTKMCPPLTSNSLDIKCTHNGNYADCSNFSMNGTIAISSCKPTYLASYGQETPQTLVCQPNGMWNKKLDICTPPKPCVLPTVEGVKYSYEGSNEILSHGTSINQNLTVFENCELGYYKVNPNSSRICQGDGNWISATNKLCLKMCPPLTSDTSDFKCTLNGNYADCSNFSMPNTIAIPSCKPTYFAFYEQKTPPELVCQSSGTWDEQLYKCSPYNLLDCGKEYIINRTDKELFGMAPWNAGIYKLNNISTKTSFDLICGGSIISPKFIVTAVHCFWKDGRSSAIQVDLYKISVGKYDRNFTVIDNEFTQIMNVNIIKTYPGYYGASGYHLANIAIIVLQNNISYSTIVAPICIDWNNIYNLNDGDQGKIVGWGRTKEGFKSSILLETFLPYINRTNCQKMYSKGFDAFVTDDKFCSGSALGPEIGSEYSGAGLSFLHSNSNYLTGVVSVQFSEIKNSIAVVTNLNPYIDWIRELYFEHH